MTASTSSLTGLSLAQTILQITGNFSSATGAIFITASYIWILPLREHFRHRLILNLAIADAINGCMGLFSQFHKIATNGKGLKPGIACKVDGFLVQLSIQAVDISIFAIAIATVLAVTKPRYFERWSDRKSILITIATWGFPVTTAFIILGLNKYEPATGGWCWIATQPVYLRYAMTHGWRFLIIAIIMVLYTYLYFYLRWHFKEMTTLASGNTSSSTSRRLGIFKRKGNTTLQSDLGDESDDVKLVNLPKKNTTNTSTPGRPTLKMSNEHTDKYNKIKKVMLMKAYPVWFVILWIPGLANRMVEATGGKSKALTLLQTSTAFVGLANAVTYGWNEGIAREFKRWLDERRRKGSVGPLGGGRFP